MGVTISAAKVAFVCVVSGLLSVGVVVLIILNNIIIIITQHAVPQWPCGKAFAFRAADSGINREIENRIQKANNVSYQLALLLKHSDIPMETKSKIMNSIFVPTLTYQCQTWTMTKPLERKITTCEMRCLRKAVNKPRRDMIPNTKIREMVGTKSIHHHIQQQRTKWFGHLTRLPIQHPAQRAYRGFRTRMVYLKYVV